MDAVREALDLPESVIPFAVVPIGRPAAPTSPLDRYKPERAHIDGWSSPQG